VPTVHIPYANRTGRLTRKNLSGRGYSKEKIADMLLQQRLTELAALAEGNAAIGSIVRSVQAQLIRNILSSMAIMQSKSTRILGQQIDDMISNQIASKHIQYNRRLVRDIKAIVVLETLKRRSPQEVLIAETERAMTGSVRLLFPSRDSAFTQQLLNLPYANLAIGRDLRLELPTIVKSIMMDAFATSWATLSDDQFPLLYKVLILNIISNKLVVNVMGIRATDWTIRLNFEQLFGDYKDLQEGYHYGALLAGPEKGAVPLNTLWKRSTIPYKDQLLKNPVSVRYEYWKAVWQGRRFYSSFGARSRPYHYKRLNQAKQAAQERLGKQAEARNKILESSAKKRGGRYHFTDEGAYGRLQEVQQRMRNTMAVIDSLEQHQDRPPLEIPRGLKMTTIMARVAYWGGKNIAPVWLLLQYGQVRYPPIIPPKGVFEKFKLLLNAELEKRITKIYNTQFAKLQETPKGTYTISSDRPVSMPLPLGISKQAEAAMRAGTTALPGNRMYVMAEQAVSGAIRNVEKAVVFTMTKRWTRVEGGKIETKSTGAEGRDAIREMITTRKLIHYARAREDEQLGKNRAIYTTNRAYKYYGNPATMDNPAYAERLRRMSGGGTGEPNLSEIAKMEARIKNVYYGGRLPLNYTEYMSIMESKFAAKASRRASARKGAATRRKTKMKEAAQVRLAHKYPGSMSGISSGREGPDPPAYTTVRKHLRHFYYKP
jgi:hypothetical protein